MRPITPASIASIASMPAAGLSSSAVQQGSLLSPSVTKAYEMSGAEERAVLRKRVRELESALSRAVTTLSRERKERHEYQIEEKRRLKEDEEAIRAWRKEMEAQMARVRKEAQEQSIMAQQGTMNELSALEQETKALQEREKQARVDLLRRQVARRMMNADITLIRITSFFNGDFNTTQLTVPTIDA